MKKLFPVITAFLFCVFIFSEINAAPNEIQNKKVQGKKGFLLEKFKASHQKDFEKFKADLKSRNGDKTQFSLEEIKTLIKNAKTGARVNKSAKAKRDDFSMAAAFDNHGWLASSDYVNSDAMSLFTTQSLPMTLLDDGAAPMPVFGGTTVKYGLQITTTPWAFLIQIMDIPLTFAPIPEPYTALDAAYDYSSDILYVLFLNESSGGPGAADKTSSAGKPGVDGRPLGFYLGAYRFDLSVGLTMEPVEDLKLLYLGPTTEITDWAKLYIGLACSQNGQLYTVNYKDKKLCSINKTTGDVTPIAVLDIPFLDPADDIDNYIGYEFINLECDYITDKLYLVDAVHEGFGGGGRNVNNKNIGNFSKNQGDPPPPVSFSQLYGINPLTADATLLLDGSGHNFLWTDDGWVNQNHFVTGFTLAQSGIILNSPGIGDVLFSGNIFPIVWLGLRITSSNVEYSTDNGVSWITIARNVPVRDLGPYGLSGNLYEWQVPYNLPPSIIIRVTDANNHFAFDQRSAPVHALHVLSPNGGENWQINSLQTISWYSLLPVIPDRALSKKGSDIFMPVDIYYTTDGNEYNLIASGVPSQDGINTYQWLTPSTTSSTCKVLVGESFFAAGDNNTVRMRDALIYSDSSDEFFTLSAPPSNGDLVITSPNGKETFQGGRYQYITWTRFGVVQGSFLLEYSSDGGRTWNKINTSPIAGVMRYNWRVPQINSTHCLVRISNYLSHREYDRSDNEFTINTATIADAKNFPNPFNPTTRIVFGLEKSAYTSLKVFNSIGQQVTELVNKQLEAGMHEYEFNASNLPSGVYFYNLKRDDKTEVHKMLLLK